MSELSPSMCLLPFMSEWSCPVCLCPSWLNGPLYIYLFMVLHEWIVLLNVFVVFYFVPAFGLYLYMVSIYIVHEKHYKFSSQKVTIATDRSRKSCVFFNIVDWFIHSRQNNKLLSDDIFPLYRETCNLTSEKSKVRIAKHTTRLQWLQLNNLFQLSWIWIIFNFLSDISKV